MTGRWDITLGDLLERLQCEPSSRVLKRGLDNPSLYTGWDRCVAFTIVDNITVLRMREAVKSAYAMSYNIHPGVDVNIQDTAGVFIAEYNHVGVEMTPKHLEAILSGGCGIDKYMVIHDLIDGRKARILQWINNDLILMRTLDGSDIRVKPADISHRDPCDDMTRTVRVKHRGGAIERQGVMF